MRFGRVPKREKARILAAMQQSSSSRAHEQAAAAELDDAPRLLARVVRAHLDTCEFTRDRVAAMRARARDCPTYSQPTLVSNHIHLYRHDIHVYIQFSFPSKESTKCVMKVFYCFRLAR